MAKSPHCAETTRHSEAAFLYKEQHSVVTVAGMCDFN